jgi:outer membrane immunogenic protein
LANSNLGAKQSGFIGGGQVGYNWLYGAWLYGAETDIQGLTRDVNGSVATVTSGVPTFPTEAFTSTTSVSKSLDYFGTLRARFGYLLTPGFLVYGTAGLAYGGVHATTSISQADTGIAPGAVAVGYGSSASISQTRAGWTAGGGVEMQLGPRWTAKAEYLYYDLGSVSYGLPNLVANVSGFAAPTWVASAQSTAKFNGDIVRLGLNYKF